MSKILGVLKSNSIMITLVVVVCVVFTSNYITIKKLRNELSSMSSQLIEEQSVRRELEATFQQVTSNYQSIVVELQSNIREREILNNELASIKEVIASKSDGVISPALNSSVVFVTNRLWGEANTSKVGVSRDTSKSLGSALH